MASRPNHSASASASLFLASASISASWHPASSSQKLASWPRIFTVDMTLINIHNIAISTIIAVVYWLLTENYVLNATILVFMLIHTELFSNVSGLGLIHCCLDLEKIFGPRPRPHSFWPRPHAQLASLTSLAPPTFHPFLSILFFPSPLKFSKEVWGSTVSLPQCLAKNDSQLQKLEGDKIH